MDIVFIRELQIPTVIGVFEWERAIHQTIVLDVEMASDVARAAATDNLVDALNYKAVADRLTQVVQEGQFLLVETLAEAVAGVLQSEFGVRWLRLRVSKPGALKEALAVGVVIERGRPD